MHDLHLANKILKLIIDYGKKNNLTLITNVVIELGIISEHGSDISSENLQFNLKILAQNTIAENFKIKVIKNNKNSWALKEIIGQ